MADFLDKLKSLILVSKVKILIRKLTVEKNCRWSCINFFLKDLCQIFGRQIISKLSRMDMICKLHYAIHSIARLKEKEIIVLKMFKDIL